MKTILPPKIVRRSIEISNGCRLPLLLVELIVEPDPKKRAEEEAHGDVHYMAMATYPVRHDCPCGQCSPVQFVTRIMMDSDMEPTHFPMAEWIEMIGSGLLAKVLEEHPPYPKELLAYD